MTLHTGIRIRVVETGDRDARPVLMLHGWGASLYSFRHAFEHLPRAGMRAIAVDLRGFGLSDKPMRRGEYALSDYCADLDQLFSVLQLDSAAIVGHSMGGALGLRFAVTNPDRVARLVLINPTGLSRTFVQHLLIGLPRSVAARMDGALVPRWLVELILKRIAFGDPHLVAPRDVDEYWAATQLRGYVYAARATLAEFEWKPLSASERSRLASPSMVILGRQDRLIRNTPRSIGTLPRLALHELDGGHCVHEERPDVVYPLVSSFLNTR